MSQHWEKWFINKVKRLPVLYIIHNIGQNVTENVIVTWKKGKCPETRTKRELQVKAVMGLAPQRAPRALGLLQGLGVGAGALPAYKQKSWGALTLSTLPCRKAEPWKCCPAHARGLSDSVHTLEEEARGLGICQWMDKTGPLSRDWHFPCKGPDGNCFQLCRA